MAGDLHFRGPAPKPRHNSAQGSAQGEGSGSSALFRPVDDGGKRRLREVELLAAIDQIPALSSVVNQILHVAGSQRSSAADLEGLVTQDMVITGRLLKMVNSPFYALSNPVRSIGQAVALVGMNSLRSLVVAASVSSMLMVDLSPYGYSNEGLWQNSIATAALARSTALQVRGDKDLAEDCFIAALLSKVGLLVLSPFLQEQHASLREPLPGIEDSIALLERQALGYDHVWVGERLAERWQLPHRLRILLAAVAKPVAEMPQESRWPAAVVVLAQRIANAQGVGLEEPNAVPKRIESRLLAAVGLDADGLRDVLAHAREVVEAARMDLGG